MVLYGPCRHDAKTNVRPHWYGGALPSPAIHKCLQHVGELCLSCLQSQDVGAQYGEFGRCQHPGYKRTITHKVAVLPYLASVAPTTEYRRVRRLFREDSYRINTVPPALSKRSVAEGFLTGAILCGVRGRARAIASALWKQRSLH